MNMWALMIIAYLNPPWKKNWEEMAEIKWAWHKSGCLPEVIYDYKRGHEEANITIYDDSDIDPSTMFFAEHSSTAYWYKLN